MKKTKRCIEIPQFVENPDTYLKTLTYNGLARRYVKEKHTGGKSWDDIVKRADYELENVIKNNFSNVFLIVSDYVNWAKEQDIPVGPGCGTIVGSIVAYALNITNIDPIKHGLLFEYFLNPERICEPNYQLFFSIVFSNERRDEVIKYISRKYDKNHFEQIMVDTYFGNPKAYAFKNYDPVVFHFPGLRVLDVIKYTEELIHQRGGDYNHFTIENIPLSDPATFTLFAEANIDDIFYFRLDSMKKCLTQAKPENLSDLMAFISLYRPGLMEHLPQFINSKNCKVKITYPDQCFENILKETYGVIVYGEQIIQIIQRITGYSLGSAVNLYRGMLRKNDRETIDKKRIIFLEGAARQGNSLDKANAIFDMLIPPSQYVFNKSNAAWSVTIAYQTAYLKANFPNEFMTANLCYRSLLFDS